MAKRPVKKSVPKPTRETRPTLVLSSRTEIVPTHDQIAALAYELFLARGCVHGADLDDWLEAERQIQSGRVEGVRPTVAADYQRATQRRTAR